MTTRLAALLWSPALLLLAGCAVGPKYVRPAAPVPPAYKEEGPPATGEGPTWKAAAPADETLRGDWWTMFGDPQLRSDGRVEVLLSTHLSSSN